MAINPIGSTSNNAMFDLWNQKIRANRGQERGRLGSGHHLGGRQAAPERRAKRPERLEQEGRRGRGPRAQGRRRHLHPPDQAVAAPAEQGHGADPQDRGQQHVAGTEVATAAVPELAGRADHGRGPEGPGGQAKAAKAAGWPSSPSAAARFRSRRAHRSHQWQFHSSMLDLWAQKIRANKGSQGGPPHGRPSASVRVNGGKLGSVAQSRESASAEPEDEYTRTLEAALCPAGARDAAIEGSTECRPAQRAEAGPDSDAEHAGGQHPGHDRRVQSEQMKSAERRARARRAGVLPGGCVRTAGQRTSRWVRG